MGGQKELGNEKKLLSVNAAEKNNECPKNKNININAKKLFLPTTLIDKKANVKEEVETSIILSEVFDEVAREHLKTEYTCKIIAIILFIASFGTITLYYKGYLDENQTIGAFALLLISSISVFLYGVYIDKPDKVKYLSKLYTTNYLIPYKPSLLFDGSDVVPDEIVEYKDIPLDDIKKLSNNFPEPPTSFENEMGLVNVLKNKNEIVKRQRTYKFVTPAVANKDLYAESILAVFPYCSADFPSKNLLKTKLSLEEAIKHKEEIEKLEDAQRIINLINEEKQIVSLKISPFVDNLQTCIDCIDQSTSVARNLLIDRLFNFFDVHSDPELDSEYGYEFVDFDYHIKVKDHGVSKNCINPINTFQVIIDDFDESVKVDVQNAMRHGADKETNCHNRANDRVEQTRFNYQTQINMLENQVRDAESRADNASRQYNSLQSQANRIGSEARKYAQLASQCKNNAAMNERNAANAEYGGESYRAEANRARSTALQYESEANRIGSEASRIESEANRYLYEYNSIRANINRLQGQISTLISRKNTEIERIRIEEVNEIEIITEETEDAVLGIRNFIDKLVEKRNEHINIIDSVCNEFIPHENEHQKAPFEKRKDLILTLQNSLTSDLDERIKERNKVLNQIETFKINKQIKDPICIAIPFWLAVIEDHKNGSNKTIIFPPRKIKKLSTPPKLSREFTKITEPLSNSFNKTAEYLKSKDIIEQSKKYSILQSINKKTGNELDKAVSLGLIASPYAKKVKKYYGLK